MNAWSLVEASPGFYEWEEWFTVVGPVIHFPTYEARTAEIDVNECMKYDVNSIPSTYSADLAPPDFYLFISNGSGGTHFKHWRR